MFDEDRNFWSEKLTDAYFSYKNGGEYSPLIELIFNHIGHPEFLETGEGKGNLMLMEWFNNQNAIGYRGIVGVNGDSNDVRCSSIEKYAEPICHLIYNRDEYSHHCVKYREYTEWLEKRNEARYLLNKGKNFDRKNAMHTIRLLHMGIEIASGKGVIVDRNNIDRDFLLKIRNGDTTYDEFIEYVERKKNELDTLIENCALKEKVDIEYVNNLYKKIIFEELKKVIK